MFSLYELCVKHHSPLYELCVKQRLCLFAGQAEDRQIQEAKRMLTEELPEDNYTVLKYILDLLVEVCTILGSHP